MSLTTRSSNNIGIGCRVINTRSEYYTQPTLADLDNLTSENGDCFVSGFIIGRHNHGSVRFLETVNVAGIDLDNIFYIGFGSVVIYPNEIERPPVGEGLNKPAIVTLERIWKTDEREPDANAMALKSEERLKHACRAMGVEFISYDIKSGTWVFKVLHFSKYSCVPEEDDDDYVEDLPKGLGGQPLPLKPGALPPPAPEKPSQMPFASANSGEQATFLNSLNKRTLHLSSVPASRSPSGSFFGDGGLHSKDRSDSSSNIDYDEVYMDVEQLPSWTFGDGDEVKLLNLGAKEFGKSAKHSLMKSVLSSGLHSATTERDKEVTMFKKPLESNLLGQLRASLTQRKTDQSSRDKFLNKPLKVDRLLEGINHINLESKGTRTEGEESVISFRQCRKRDEIKRGKYFVRPSPATSMFAGMRTNQNHGDLSASPRRLGARVGFGPGGHFVCVKAGFKSFSTVVEIMRIDPVVLAGESRRKSLYKCALELQLINQLQYQPDISLSGDKFILERGGMASAHIQFLESFSLQGQGSLTKEKPDASFLLLKEEQQVWSLCEILWPKNGPTDGKQAETKYILTQRDNLADWFQDNCHMLFKDLYNGNDNSMKNLLLTGRKLAACEQAINDDNLTLALCLSQDNNARELCEEQIEIWRSKHVNNFISRQNMTIYELCAGIPIWTGVDFKNMTTSEWLQHFAVYLWYIAPPNESIHEIVVGYQQSIVKSSRLAQDYIFPTKADSSLANLCVQLLKAFAFLEYPLKIVLEPRTNNPDPLDYRLSWFLMLSMEQFGVLRIDPELRDNLTCGFAGQLEKLGMYQWAIYVLKHLKPSKGRQNLIKQVLGRNMHSGKYNAVDNFLVSSLGVEDDEIMDSKLVMALHEGRSYYELRYLLHFKKYIEVYRKYLEHFGEFYYSEGNIRTWDFILRRLHSVSDKMDLADWEAAGRCLYSLSCAVKHINMDDIKRTRYFPGQVQGYLLDVVTSLRHVQPRTASQVLFILELAVSVRLLANLLVTDQVFQLGSNITPFPPTGLLNTLTLSEYLEQLRIFILELNLALA